MKHNRAYSSDVFGFIDDDKAKVGRTIHGVRVLGTRDDLPQIIADGKPDEVIVATPRAQPAEIRAIVRSLEPFKIPIKTLPNLSDILSGRTPISEVRSLALEDLMSRQPVDLDVDRVHRLVRGRRVLVTGAGGSIGFRVEPPGGALQSAVAGAARPLRKHAVRARPGIARSRPGPSAGRCRHLRSSSHRPDFRCPRSRISSSTRPRTSTSR
jgi:hypothetical protein